MSIRKRRLRRNVSLILLLVTLFVGCDKAALYHNLSEHEANQIIVALNGAGIDAEKESEIVQNETYWKVVVDDEDLSRARKLLVERNLPRKEALGLSGVYQEKGLIPTPDEQKARFLLAIKGEIENSLEKIPEIVDAGVVINIPSPEEFAENGNKEPTASVVIKVKPVDRALTQISESRVQQFVANTVEDLNPRNVSVIISYLSRESELAATTDRLIFSGSGEKAGEKQWVTKGKDTISIAGLTVAKKSAGRLKIYLFIFFIILVIMAAILVVLVVRTNRIKQEYLALTSGEERPLIEGEVQGEESGPRIEGGEEEGTESE